jgi:putative aminopeptidase FrvX
MSISLHKSLIDELQKLAEENNMPFEMYVRGVLRSHALEEESISRLGGYNEYE